MTSRDKLNSSPPPRPLLLPPILITPSKGGGFGATIPSYTLLTPPLIWSERLWPCKAETILHDSPEIFYKSPLRIKSVCPIPTPKKSQIQKLVWSSATKIQYLMPYCFKYSNVWLNYSSIYYTYWFTFLLLYLIFRAHCHFDCY